ncbi:MAG: hypothetical protein ABIP48_28420 [Planctomycetota bacterium]
MGHILRGRQRVYVVTVPDDWRPQRLWDAPPTFAAGQLVAKNLRPTEAAGFCRTHNKLRQCSPEIGGRRYDRHTHQNQAD